ncbi:UNVERIFIED_CONTAM: hypothetical protein GTU68_041497 [Idotea baltica]|nr:hypothetical protein [Idotea baltica]
MNKLIEIRTGSDSDIPKIKEIYEFLNELEIPYSPRILSAHRTPENMAKEAQNLVKNGIRVSVAAAGGSAHIAGMTASETHLPIIALPVKSTFSGLDALLSMIQMPPGIPNACVGINDGKSAGILATRIAYLDNINIREKLSKNLNTKIKSILENKSINIITNNKNLDLSLLDQLEIKYNLNSNNSPISIYIDDIDKFPKLIPDDLEEISIAAPLANSDYKIENLVNVVKNPIAWVGLNRTNNAFLLSARILGIYFPEIRKNLNNYMENLKVEVIKKDIKLQNSGIEI